MWVIDQEGELVNLDYFLRIAQGASGTQEEDGSGDEIYSVVAFSVEPSESEEDETVPTVIYSNTDPKDVDMVFNGILAGIAQGYAVLDVRKP